MSDFIFTTRHQTSPRHFRRGSEIFVIKNLDETHRDAALDNEEHKKRIKVQYDKSVHPRVFNEGDLVLTYDQRYDKLGKGKFESMWYGPFIISKVLEKGSCLCQKLFPGHKETSQHNLKYSIKQN